VFVLRQAERQERLAIPHLSLARAGCQGRFRNQCQRDGAGVSHLAVRIEAIPALHLQTGGTFLPLEQGPQDDARAIAIYQAESHTGRGIQGIADLKRRCALAQASQLQTAHTRIGAPQGLCRRGNLLRRGTFRIHYHRSRCVRLLARTGCQQDQ